MSVNLQKIGSVIYSECNTKDRIPVFSKSNPVLPERILLLVIRFVFPLIPYVMRYKRRKLIKVRSIKDRNFYHEKTVYSYRVQQGNVNIEYNDVQ